MANPRGVVTLRGRFKAGALVRLVKVANEGVLRAEGGDVIAEKRVDDDACVQFTDGVEPGARYFIVGQVDGAPLEVRARGNVPDDDNQQLVHAPVLPERQKLASGVFQDELKPATAPRQVTDEPRPDASGLVGAKPDASPVSKPRRRKPAAKKAAAKSAPAKKTSAGRAPAKTAASKASPSKTTTAKASASSSARKEK